MTVHASLFELDPDATSRPTADEVLEALRPAPRFAAKDFAGYEPDPRHPSQRRALEAAREFAASTRISWWSRVLSARGAGLYLDGGFGVGKTHLLAAAWNEAAAPRAFATFDDLIHLIGLAGTAELPALLKGYRFFAVDEWELDDPGNLRMAVAFLRTAVQLGVKVATTSNTVPDELGQGRLPQKDFAREIGEMAGVFEVVRITGEDYRARSFDPSLQDRHFVRPEVARAMGAAGDRVLDTPFDRLLQELGRMHPAHFADACRRIDTIVLRDVRPIRTMSDGLRWVHWVDRVYSERVRLALVLPSERAPGPVELFPPEFLRGGYAKKFGRCLSRMEELAAESVTALRDPVSRPADSRRTSPNGF